MIEDTLHTITEHWKLIFVCMALGALLAYAIQEART